MGMTEIEISELAKLETIIDKGKAAFIDVGEALASIRDKRLYRDAYDSFEDYCQERWGFTRQRAHQLMQASEVVSTIVDKSTPSSHLPNEGQARELAKVEKAKRKAVWDKAVESAPKNKKGTPKVTAAQVKRVAQEIAPIDELEAATADEPADKDPVQPWADYNFKLEHMAAMAREMDCIRKELVEDADNQTRLFAEWMLTYTSYFTSLEAEFNKHRIANWATPRQQARLPGGRNFLYVYEVNKKGVRNG
jgi:hypothetical protein